MLIPVLFIEFPTFSNYKISITLHIFKMSRNGYAIPTAKLINISGIQMLTDDFFVIVQSNPIVKRLFMMC